jgi:hypothetical protein
MCEMTDVHPIGTEYQQYSRSERTPDGWLVCWMPGCKTKAEWSETRLDHVTHHRSQKGVWCNDHCPRGIERWIEFKIRYGTYGRRGRKTDIIISIPKQSQTIAQVIEAPIRIINLD